MGRSLFFCTLFDLLVLVDSSVFLSYLDSLSCQIAKKIYLW